MSVQDLTHLDTQFKKEIEGITHSSVADCYQCGKCTAGCPMSFMMDVVPNNVIRYLQMGRGEELLQSQAIWLCLSCQTCTTRCPQQVKIAETIDALRSKATEKGIKSPNNRNTQIFHEVFLNLIKKHGRLTESWLVALYKIKSLNLTDDMILGLKMGLKGKLGVLPEKIQGADRIRKIFEKCGM